MTKKIKIIISLILIFTGFSCRLLPHSWNFAPIAAITLFSAVYLGRRYALIVPIVAMILGDIFLGFYETPVMFAVYISYILIALIGATIKKYKSFEVVFAGSIFSSLIFFIVTNFAVWQFSPWYAKTMHGLLECYTLAMPFFRNTLMGDLFYVGIFFGAYELVLFFNEKYQEDLSRA